MIFCKACGEALNLFETHDEEMCYSCLRKQLPPEKPAPPVRGNGDGDLLANAVLSHEDNKFVLRSAEDWVLWSAPDSEIHSLGSILSKAGRIQEIRKKRRK